MVLLAVSSSRGRLAPFYWWQGLANDLGRQWHSKYLKRCVAGQSLAFNYRECEERDRGRSLNKAVWAHNSSVVEKENGPKIDTHLAGLKVQFSANSIPLKVVFLRCWQKMFWNWSVRSNVSRYAALTSQWKSLMHLFCSSTTQSEDQ